MEFLNEDMKRAFRRVDMALDGLQLVYEVLIIEKQEALP